MGGLCCDRMDDDREGWGGLCCDRMDDDREGWGGFHKAISLNNLGNNLS